MYKMNVETVDLQKAREIANDHNKTSRLYAEIYTAIIDVLKKFDGKRISKRVETALKADCRLAGYYIDLSSTAGMYQLGFWGKELDYGHRNHVFMGYHKQDEIIDIEKVKERNEGFLRCSIIDMTTLDERINKWNIMVTEMHAFMKTEGDDISFIINRG